MMTFVLMFISGVVLAAETTIPAAGSAADRIQTFVREHVPVFSYRMSELGGRIPDSDILGVADETYSKDVIIGIRNGQPIYARLENKQTQNALPVKSNTVTSGDAAQIQTPTPTPIPTPAARRALKKSVTIALLGDSMIETLGEGYPELRSKLAATYPETDFTILNYGAGATDIEYGIIRITQKYEYLGKTIPSVASKKPDIIVLESFGYNPIDEEAGGIKRHWQALSRAVETVRTSIPEGKVLIAATIAPNATVFGDGAPAIAFSQEEKKQRTDVIVSYLENAIQYAQKQRIPLADAYTPSLLSDGNGNLAYINAADNLHPSPAGRKLFADVLVQAIVKNKMIE